MLYRLAKFLLPASLCLHSAVAAPAPLQLQSRASPSSIVQFILSELQAVANSSVSGSDAASSIALALAAATPTATPSNLADIVSGLVAAWPTSASTSTLQASPAGAFLTGVVDMMACGLGPSNFPSYASSLSTGINNPTNSNPSPTPSIYPFKSTSDAPYSQTEAQLRQVIYIPSTFTYGKVPPVILMPGTGERGGVNFIGNYIKLFTGSSYADPVWINPPGFELQDAQVSSEYIAYAINYINAITKSKVAVLGWSQGNINTQWAFKYWPSTRNVTTNHIAMSPDYHGTIFANFVAPSVVLSAPSILQQEYTSNYITALRSNYGDSAYVPTTTIYSAFFDEIVEPMQNPNASAFLNDARKVGVSNNQVQSVCAGKAAGGFFTHEGILYNSLAFALAKDALTNGGPGQPSRITNLDTICAQGIAPGLTMQDVLLTEYTIPVAAYEILTYPTKTLVEPPLMSYATRKS